MKCKRCGNEMKPNARFCDFCGLPVQNTPTMQVRNAPPQRPYPQRPYPQNYSYPPISQQNMQKKPEKKPFYKNWIFWLIMVLSLPIALPVMFAVMNTWQQSLNYPTATDDTAISRTEEKTTEDPKVEEKTTVDPAVIEQSFKDSCETIDFDVLSRNPDKYKGNNYKFTGEVIQVQEGWFDSVDLRINVTEIDYEYLEGSYWEDTIYATITIPEGEDNILEDDVITIWGTCDGEYTYEAVLGNKITLPKIDIKYYELVE